MINTDPFNSPYSASTDDLNQVNTLQDAERVLDALSGFDDLYGWEHENETSHTDGINYITM